MKIFDILVESRIREWQKLSEAEKKRRALERGESTSYEAQFVNQIDQLIDDAKVRTGDGRTEILKKVDEKVTEQLMMLERRGKTLTAKMMADHVAARKRELAAERDKKKT